jgi:putative transposase
VVWHLSTTNSKRPEPLLLKCPLDGEAYDRTNQAKDCASRDSMLTFVYKLALSAERRWGRIRGFYQLAKVIDGVEFRDGVEINNSDRVAA